MNQNITCYYGFSVTAEDFLLPSELRELLEYQETSVIPENANQIVRFIANSLFSVNTINEENYLCIALEVSPELKMADLTPYEDLLEDQLNQLNMLVPRQCYIEWKEPKLFCLDNSLLEDH